MLDACIEHSHATSCVQRPQAKPRAPGIPAASHASSNAAAPPPRQPCACAVLPKPLWLPHSGPCPDAAAAAASAAAAAAPDGDVAVDVGVPLPAWQLPDPHAHWRAQGQLLDAWLVASLVLLLVHMACEARLRWLPVAATLGIASALVARVELPGGCGCANVRPHPSLLCSARCAQRTRLGHVLPAGPHGLMKRAGCWARHASLWACGANSDGGNAC